MTHERAEPGGLRTATLRRWAVVLAAMGAAAAVTSLRTGCWAQRATANGVVLYDGATDAVVASARLVLTAVDRSLPARTVTHEEWDPALLGTRLDTLVRDTEMAGYAVRRAALPRLHREQGFVVELAMKVEAERHVREDRAGVSVTILDEELRGIELGFWEDTVFAQEGGALLFVHAEEASIDTRPMTVWRIEVRGDRYRLFAGEREVLVGALRDYRAWKPPLPSFPDAYEQPSSVVVSDNTTSAAARFVLRSLVVTPL